MTAEPRTPKGEETRRALLAAAAQLFAERGYHDTTVPAIVQAAGVGHGTFYEYFRNRRDILVALTEELRSARSRPHLRSASLENRIRQEIFWYLSDHVENRTLSKVWYEAERVDPEIAETRRRNRMRRIERVRRGIEAAGPRPDIDPAVAAAALTAMMEEFARRWFVEAEGNGDGARDILTAAETLATIWLSVTQPGVEVDAIAATFTPARKND